VRTTADAEKTVQLVTTNAQDILTSVQRNDVTGKIEVPGSVETMAQLPLVRPPIMWIFGSKDALVPGTTRSELQRVTERIGEEYGGLSGAHTLAGPTHFVPFEAVAKCASVIASIVFELTKRLADGRALGTQLNNPEAELEKVRVSIGREVVMLKERHADPRRGGTARLWCHSRQQWTARALRLADGCPLYDVALSSISVSENATGAEMEVYAPPVHFVPL
jgi:hypothetical protein